MSKQVYRAIAIALSHYLDRTISICSLSRYLLLLLLLGRVM
jgi:hypothetical protein